MKKLLTLTLLTSSLITSFTMQSMENIITPNVTLGASITAGVLGIGAIARGYYLKELIPLTNTESSCWNTQYEGTPNYTKLKQQLNLDNMPPKKNESDQKYLERISHLIPENILNDIITIKNDINLQNKPEVTEENKEIEDTQAAAYFLRIKGKNKKAAIESKKFYSMGILSLVLCGCMTSTYIYSKMNQES